MSCLNYENIEIEYAKGEGQDDVAHRVAEVLDLELAQGSMPA